MARLNRITTHILAALVGLSGVFFYDMLYETHPIDSFYRVATPLEVVPGQIVTITSDVNRSKGNCSSVIKRQFIDQSGTIIAELFGEVIALPAGKEHFKTFVEIPNNAKPGYLRMRVTSTFSCNRLQELFKTGDVLVLPDVIFTVKTP